MSLIFVWESYKTDECHGECSGASVQDKDDFFKINSHHQFQCTRWHDKIDRRRPVVVSENNKVNYSRLYLKDTYISDYKHCNNYIEYLYHPQNYKSRECPSISSGVNGIAAIKCVYGQVCPYYHSIQEKNDWLNDSRALKFRAVPKEKFTQTLLDDFNNVQSSSKQLEKMYETSMKGNSIMNKSKNSQSQTPLNSNQVSLSNLDNASFLLLKDAQMPEIIQNTGYQYPYIANQAIQGQQTSSQQQQQQQQTFISESLQEQKLQVPSKKASEEQRTQALNKEETKKQSEDNIFEQIIKSITPPLAVNTQEQQKSAAPEDVNGFLGTAKLPIDYDETSISNPTFNNTNIINNNHFNLETLMDSGNKQPLSLFDQIISGLKLKETQPQLPSSSTNLAQPVNSTRNNKREKQHLKEQKSKGKAAFNIDLTAQLSKITDLSSNDDYLKQSLEKPQSKMYQYGQSLGLHESQTVEFKNYQKISQNLQQKAMEATLRTQEYGQYICGFLNHRGGTMYIGVHDEGWVDGIFLNSKQRDWFCLHIDNNVTSQIEPRLVVGELRIEFIEVLNKPILFGQQGTAYVIEISIVKTNFTELYLYDNQVYIRKTASLTKMSIPDIKSDLMVKLKKKYKAEANTVNKLVLFEDKSDLANQSYEQLSVLLKKLEGAVSAVKERMAKTQNQSQPQILL